MFIYSFNTLHLQLVTRGTVYGIGQSLGSLGRSVGPLISTPLFAWSERNGMWSLCIITAYSQWYHHIYGQKFSGAKILISLKFWPRYFWENSDLSFTITWIGLCTISKTFSLENFASYNIACIIDQCRTWMATQLSLHLWCHCIDDHHYYIDQFCSS